MEAASVDWGLAGKSVIVTGASSGIGASTARALGAAGASVLLVGRDEARLSEHAETTQKAGGRAEIARVDLEDIEATATLPELAVKAFGSLHGIVHTRQPVRPAPARGHVDRVDGAAVAHERRRAARDHESRRPAPDGGRVDRVHRLDDRHRGLPGLLGLHGHQGRRELHRAGARRRARAERHPRQHRRAGLRAHAHAAAAPRRERGLRGLDPRAHAGGAHRWPGRGRRRASSSCSRHSRGTSTAPPWSPTVAGSPNRAGRAGAANGRSGTASASPTVERRCGHSLAPANAPLLGDLGGDRGAVRGQPPARERERQQERPALDAAVRRHPGDREHRPDARHPAARARPLRAGDDHAHDDHRHARPERPRRSPARGHRRSSSSPASPRGSSAASPSTWFKITPLVATLGVNALLQGVVFQITSGASTAAAPPGLASFALEKTLGIPNAALIAVDRDRDRRRDHPRRRSSGGASSRWARAPRPRTPRVCA